MAECFLREPRQGFGFLMQRRRYRRFDDPDENVVVSPLERRGQLDDLFDVGKTAMCGRQNDVLQLIERLSGSSDPVACSIERFIPLFHVVNRK